MSLYSWIRQLLTDSILGLNRITFEVWAIFVQKNDIVTCKCSRYISVNWGFLITWLTLNKFFGIINTSFSSSLYSDTLNISTIVDDGFDILNINKTRLNSS